MAAATGLTGYRLPSGEVAIPLPGSSLEQTPEGAEELHFGGGGRIVTFSVVHVATPAFRAKAPYALAVVELEDGARLMAMIDLARPEELAIDASVRYAMTDEFGHHFMLAG